MLRKALIIGKGSALSGKRGIRAVGIAGPSSGIRLNGELFLPQDENSGLQECHTCPENRWTGDACVDRNSVPSKRGGAPIPAIGPAHDPEEESPLYPGQPSPEERL